MNRLLLWVVAFLPFSVAWGQPSATSKALETRAGQMYDAGKCAEATRQYEKLLLQAPQNTSYLSRAAYCYFQEGQFQNAKEKYRLALLYTPETETELRALYSANLSACLDKLGASEKAFDYAQRAYRLEENAFHLWNVLAVA